MQTLHRWLCRHISPAEFSRIIDFTDGFGVGRARLRAAMPGEHHCAAEFYHRCLLLLEQHGILDAPRFFDALRAERPLRAREIGALAHERGPEADRSDCPLPRWIALRRFVIAASVLF